MIGYQLCGAWLDICSPWLAKIFQEARTQRENSMADPRIPNRMDNFYVYRFWVISMDFFQRHGLHHVRTPKVNSQTNLQDWAHHIRSAPVLACHLADLWRLLPRFFSPVELRYKQTAFF